MPVPTTEDERIQHDIADRAFEHGRESGEENGSIRAAFAAMKVELANVIKALAKIEDGELERAKEAREDRHSVKMAIYSFVGALVASGFGTLIYLLAAH